VAQRVNNEEEQRRLSHEALWRRFDAMELRLTAAVSERMLELANLAPGMRVLDLATGRGEPAIRAAHCVGETGHVLGIDLSEELLDMARARAAAEGLSNVELRAANAEKLESLPPGSFDAVTARWGLMYMTDPVLALTGARWALQPAGTLVAAFHAEPERVAFYSLPARLLARVHDVPAVEYGVPGMFRYANLESIEADFAKAGLAVDHVEEIETVVFESTEDEDLLAWIRALGKRPFGLADLSEAKQRSWEAELLAETRPARPGEPRRLGGVTRIIRARPGG